MNIKLSSIVLIPVMLFLTIGLMAQIQLTGEVRDSVDNTGLIGAIVAVGETKGTTTDNNGRFILNVDEIPSSLTISYLVMIPGKSS